MRLHDVAITPPDWTVHRRSDKEYGRVFRASTVENGPSPGYFPPLPAVVREALPSLGVHTLLPFVLKHFSIVCADPQHPAYVDVMYNLEREWAWSLGNPLMNEVSVQNRVFVQPPEMLAFLGKVAADLLRVPLHPLERISTYVSWSGAAVLQLMHHADAVLERNRRPCTYFMTGDRSTFLAYYPGADAFVARSTPKLSSSDRPVRGGGVGSAA